MPSGRRVELDAFYVLHHRPWRDSSRMLEVLTQEHGRLTLFARGVRGPRARLASILQPFRPLLGSWHGRGDTGQLVHAELAPETEGRVMGVPAPALMSAYYLNELVIKLSVRADPQPQLYALYEQSLGQLTDTSAGLEATLRGFELRLLEVLGYGLAFDNEAREGGAIDAHAYYHFHPEHGFVATSSNAGARSSDGARWREGAQSSGLTSADGAVSGALLQAIAREDWTQPGALEQARRILRAALDHVLEGRELRTRQVARAVSRHRVTGSSSSEQGAGEN
jgi:DNA repair protein RecO (recombination protein O)